VYKKFVPENLHVCLCVDFFSDTTWFTYV
jgi:hypothetical protein